MLITKPVVVIGAGASGLPAIKTCLEEGLNVVCFEKTDDIGGLWRFREQVTDGVASVMRSTIINSSKEPSAYSDFPPPPLFSNFMHNSYMVQYFDMYAERFNLRPHIRFRTEVLHIAQSTDFCTTGEWVVTIRNLESGTEEHFEAGAVMVCNGHHSHPNMPTYSGLSQFQGRVMHSHSYKDFRGFEDKKILVVGIGNSGGDIAVELSRVSSKVYLSTRSGSWVLSRVGKNGIPHDIHLIRRASVYCASLMPGFFINGTGEFMTNAKFDHELYNLKPKHRIFEQHPTVNDDLPNRILSGTLTVKGDIHHFSPAGVVFKGEEKLEYEIDAVVLATGYNICFPFLEDHVVPVGRYNKVELYKHVFPPHLERATLAVIGLIQPLGAIMPISEIQSRWATRVFKGLCQLPARQVMEDVIKGDLAEMRGRYAESPRHTIQVDSLTYCDIIAAMIGVKPNLPHLALTDPKLFLAVLFGPFAAYQYRLQGPHSWKEAREAVMCITDRVKVPLQTNLGRKFGRSAVPEKNLVSKLATFFNVGLFLLLVVLIFSYFD